MQKKITMFTVGFMMGMQIVSPPPAKSLEGSGAIMAVLAVAAVPAGIILAMDSDDDDAPAGDTSPSDGNTSPSGSCSSGSGESSGLDKVMEGALDILTGGGS